MNEDNSILYALPGEVCSYGTFEEFSNSRKEQGQWVYWNDRVELILKGDYNSVKPLHVELSPTYICNFACPWCSCRLARQDWLGEGMDVFTHPLANEKTIMCKEKLFNVISELSKSNTGIQWVGGEPTLNPFTFDGIKYANDLGVNQCLFTNGSILPVVRLKEILKSNLSFLRISLDCVSTDLHTLFHGINPKKNYSERVLNNIQELAFEKDKMNSPTGIGFSIVIDEVNFSDLENTLNFILNVAGRYPEKEIINFLIIRPVFKYQGVESNVTSDTNVKLWNFLNRKNELIEKLKSFKIDVVFPSPSFYTSTPSETQTTISSELGCLSGSWFSAIKPSGEMEACSDVYGDPNYIVGNLGDSTIDEIWNGEKRDEVFKHIKGKNCFTTRCPKNGRGFYLNRIFYQIEMKRREGKMEDVKQWINDLRTVLPLPKHSFFL